MAEKTFRKFAWKNCVEFSTGKHSEDKDTVDLKIDNNEINTSLTGTINKYGCL